MARPWSLASYASAQLSGSAASQLPPPEPPPEARVASAPHVKKAAPKS
jgi:hypothetical protein